MIRKEPLLVLNTVLAVLMMYGVWMYDIPGAITSISVGALVIGSLIARGHLVSRSTIEIVTAQRDQWRDATRANQQEAEELKAIYDEMATLSFVTGNVREPIAQHSKTALDRNTDPRNSDLSVQKRIALARAHIKPSCPHPTAVDVEISTGEVVAQICTECHQQITSPKWMEEDLVDEAARTVRREPLTPGRHKSEKVGCGYCGKMIHDHTCPHRQCSNGHTLRPGASWCNQCD